MSFIVSIITNQSIIVTELAHSALTMYQWRKMLNAFSVVRIGNMAKCLNTENRAWKQKWHKIRTWLLMHVYLSFWRARSKESMETKMGLLMVHANLMYHRKLQLKNIHWKKMLMKLMNSSVFCAYCLTSFQLIFSSEHRWLITPIRKSSFILFQREQTSTPEGQLLCTMKLRKSVIWTTVSQSLVKGGSNCSW